MFCISVSFKKTPLEIRQQFAFSEEEETVFLSDLLREGKITGGVVVSTCNRSEVYFTGDSFLIEELENALSTQKGISREDIKKYCLYYQGKNAVRHLFKVVCGLDSMVLGEDEILHQVKGAYLRADKAGFTNGELNIIFQGAFNCAKLSKSGTRLSNTPVSIGTLTANAVERYLKEHLMPENAEGILGKVLVIGATGKMGSIVVKDLLAKGISVIGTSRKRHQAEGVLLQSSGNLEWQDFDRRYEKIYQVQAVVSATTSPHYTLTKEAFLSYAGQQGYLLVDLGVPRDIDRELDSVENVCLRDIDHFKMLSKENNNIKLGELGKAESILQECLEDVLKKLYMRDFQRKMENKSEEEWFQKMLFYLKEVLDSEQLLQVFDRICEQEGLKNGVFSIYDRD